MYTCSFTVIKMTTGFCIPVHRHTTDIKQNTGLCTQACAYTYDISRTLCYKHMFICTLTDVKWNTGLFTPVHRHTTDIKQNTGLCTHTYVYIYWYWVEHNAICTCSHVQLLILNGILDYVHLYTGEPTDIKYNTGICTTIRVKAQTFFICLIPWDYALIFDFNFTLYFMFSIDLGLFYTLSNIASLPSFTSSCAVPANKMVF